MFFCGMLVCAIVAQAGEAGHRVWESRRRQYIARIRGTKTPELIQWPEEVPL